jgi:hypothetical protein
MPPSRTSLERPTRHAGQTKRLCVVPSNQRVVVQQPSGVSNRRPPNEARQLMVAGLRRLSLPSTRLSARATHAVGHGLSLPSSCRLRRPRSICWFPRDCRAGAPGATSGKLQLPLHCLTLLGLVLVLRPWIFEVPEVLLRPPKYPYQDGLDQRRCPARAAPPTHPSTSTAPLPSARGGEVNRPEITGGSIS